MHNSKAREHYLELVERRNRMWRVVVDDRGAQTIVPLVIPERGRYRLAKRFKRTVRTAVGG